ncbi:hypothetical protein CA54_47040 [Symmachiella macrocystis]|uniref:Uncharacterized protein n=1 Tax=Symmachiella macrocystis TaxID=2527985 RepID=A0A5C6BCM7_9PLAN|nr:hypothetical protein CA54_47040 [Symmachiella macrocystis]
MTTDKPKWWQSWMVYTLIGLLATVGPYVGGYFLLGEHGQSIQVTRYTRTPVDIVITTHPHYCGFKHDWMRKVFAPLGWAEAKLSGEVVHIFSRNGRDRYQPEWQAKTSN